MQLKFYNFFRAILNNWKEIESLFIGIITFYDYDYLCGKSE